MTLLNTNKIARNLDVVDLFAGAGGFALGFQLAGYNISCALEIDQWASETIRYNHPCVNVINDDIRKFQTEGEIRSVCSDEPLVIIGGPPCQGFSIAGPAQKDPRDPRNSLFQEYARWVGVLRPKIFVMENVKGLLTRRNSNGELVVDIIKKTFEQLDYKVEIWILNSLAYGVPQIRERIFIVGNRIGLESIGTPPMTHTFARVQDNHQFSLLNNQNEFAFINLIDSISDLPELFANEGQEAQDYLLPPQNEYQRAMRKGSETLYNHVAMQHSHRLVERFKQIKWGESSSDVSEEYRARKRNGNGEVSESSYDQNNRRLHPNKPSHTITASFYANFIHPFQHRNLTAREGARIQSFPDWYRFMGKKTVPSHSLLLREGRLAERHLCQYNQIGNAVPPLLAKAIACHIKKVINQ